MVTISEVKGNSRENRTSAHTHIKGLGLKSDGYAETNGAGFVGQIAAREVSGGMSWPRNVLIAVIANSKSGMWCCRRFDQVEEDVRTRSLTSGGSWHWKNSSGFGGVARAWD